MCNKYWQSNDVIHQPFKISKNTKPDALNKRKNAYPGNPKNRMQYNFSVINIFTEYLQFIRLSQFQL